MYPKIRLVSVTFKIHNNISLILFTIFRKNQISQDSLRKKIITFGGYSMIRA